MKKHLRSEAAVFENLQVLTRTPGYVHAIANICHRDIMVTYTKEMKASDLLNIFRRDRLIRTEITTILGLLVRGPVDISEPNADTLQEYVDHTDRLMNELHQIMGAPGWYEIMKTVKTDKCDAYIWRGEMLREPIFYGGESAYTFQYRDLVLEKYGMDDPWLVHNKGFSIIQAQAITRAMCELMDVKATRTFAAMKISGYPPVSWLSVFEQTPEEIAFRSLVPMEQVCAFLKAFTLRGENSQFQSVGDFNWLNATPLLATGDNSVLLFQQYSILEALYESPFYWMMADDAYKGLAANHLGAFTEVFATRRLASVFGSQQVHSNVGLESLKGKRPGEIDVLVVFGNRLIIVQAKSKKLTLEARRGNDRALKEDFAGAIQASYDQALLCAEAILAGNCRLVNSNGAEIVLPHLPKEILIFNLVSDHYPALAFQAREFLKYQTSDVICSPFVMDVFLLDALTEMLDTPLRFFSYAKLRVENIDRITLSHELTALSFHLKRNLWFESDFDMVMLDDDIAADLDLAMTVRRDNVPGRRIPEGILTRLAGTLFEHLLSQIEKKPNLAMLEIGFHLLTLGEDTCLNIHRGLESITSKARLDGMPHDFTIGDGSGGITFHCNPTPSKVAMQKLGGYCELRKYAQRAPQWFGISVDPRANLQFGVVLEFEWQKSNDMDVVTASMRKPIPVAQLAEFSGVSKRGKAGRNDPCPCGSGSKYKRCCLGKQATSWDL